MNVGVWVKKSPLLDGSGIYRYNEVEYKIVRHHYVGSTWTVAYIDGKEIAKATSFTRLLRKLDKLK